jgi:serine/threonine protein phosphatase PrpC
MHNNKNFHFKHVHAINTLEVNNMKPIKETKNLFFIGNNIQDTKRFNETNSLQKLKHQNNNQKKNNFEENNKKINNNNIRNNSKQPKLNINFNLNNYNSEGGLNKENQNFNRSPNFNVTKNKFLINFNLPSFINAQERVINFGQDKSENNFKKTLRKGASNLIKNSSINIINNNPNINNVSNKIFNSSLRGLPNSSPFSQTSNDYFKTSTSKEIFNTKLSYEKTQLNSFMKNNSNSNSNSNRNSNSNNNTNNKNNIINNNNLLFKYTGYNNFNNNNIDNNILNINSNSNNFKNYSDSTSSSNIYSTNSTSKEDHLNYIYEKNANSVREYAYKEDPNYKCRGAMEDMAKLIDKFTNNPDIGLFAIYDGHGGGEIAKYLKNRIPEVLGKILSPKKKLELDEILNMDIENSLNSVFHKVDEEIKLMPESEYMGSTAVVVLICKEKDQKLSLVSQPQPHSSAVSVPSRSVIYCANVGDSRCVLISNFGVKRLSYDHKASDRREIDRVNNTGGMIFNGRVFGQLIITRAFGDSSLKKYGVSASPHICKNYINDKDKYLVLASDGVWDVIEDDELLRLSQSVTNSDELTKLIIKTSLIRGSQDNLSCIVLRL